MWIFISSVGGLCDFVVGLLVGFLDYCGWALLYFFCWFVGFFLVGLGFFPTELPFF